ncbi:hypothetical protein CW747_14330 [Staphylococcus shinii]|uniref:DsbA family protein n=1 Tax=Staphylococcus shinii TaxID=2912228 RepID=UPI000C3449F2|nr:DsbA family protein [Staphylococcus shinii]PKI08245.1 hypothetical protein CW747_14330 [Staphylococcus shinii]
MKKNLKIIIILSGILIVFLLTISFYFINKISFENVNGSKLEGDVIQNPKHFSNSANHTIVAFGDFNCPYCKKYEENGYTKLKNNLIDSKKVNYYFVNAAFLGESSIRASRAAHAVNIYAPKEYWKFHHLMYETQSSNKKNSLSNKIIDKNLSNLNLSKSILKKIKKDYKTRKSTSWKLTERDQELTKKYNVKEVPTIYIDGKFVEDPYSFKSIEKELK